MSWALVEASKRGSYLEFPIEEEMEKDLRAPAGSWYLLSPDLRVLPCGSPVPRGEDLRSGIVKGESLFFVPDFSNVGSLISHLPLGEWRNDWQG